MKIIFACLEANTVLLCLHIVYSLVITFETKVTHTYPEKNVRKFHY